MVVFDAQRAVMFADDAAGDSEAEAGAAIFRGEMREEKFVFILGRNAVARVGDFDFDGVALPRNTRGDGDGAKRRAFEGFRGVVDQIYDNTAEQFSIRFYDGQIRREFAVQRDAFEALVEYIKSLRNDRIHVRGSKARGGEAGELRKFVDQRFECLDRKSVV